MQEIKNYCEAQPLDIIHMCDNCRGYEPCLCDNSDYKEITKFVYDALMNCKPTI